MTSISELVDILGKDYLIQNVDKFFLIKYIKCSENRNPESKALVEENYEESLDNNIETARNSIELKSVDRVYDCSLTLDILNNNFKHLLLEKAEYILIECCTFPMIKLVNNKKPETGIYINCDIQYLGTRLKKEYYMRRQRTVEAIEYATLAFISVALIGFFGKK